MRLRPLSFAFLASLLVLAGCGSEGGPGSAEAPRADTSAASASQRADTLEGGPILQRSAFDLAQYDDEVVLLNFWATWCAPCRAEMPDLVALQRDLGPKGLQIVGVATDRQGREAVAPYLRQEPVNYPIVLDPDQEIGAQYGGMAALPTTLIIGRDGEVRRRIVGRVRPGPLRERLEDVLAGGSGAAEAS